MHTPFFNTLRLHKLNLLHIPTSNVTLHQTLLNSQFKKCSVKCVLESFTLKGEIIYCPGAIKAGKSMEVTLFVDYIQVPSQICEYIGMHLSPYILMQIRQPSDHVNVIDQILALMYRYCKQTGLGL